MKHETLGRMQCPECFNKGAAIKRDKAGKLYRWCMDGCGAKFHARDEDQEFAMRQNLFKDAPDGESQGDAGGSAPVTEQKKSGFTIGGLR